MADFTLSDMPDTLCRVDTAGVYGDADGSTAAPFGGVFGVLPRSGGSVYVKGPTGTLSFFDDASSTFKTIEIPSLLSQYGKGNPPDLCRIVTLPVLGDRAIIWHAGSVGIYAPSPPAWATPNAARRTSLVRPISDGYVNSGALYVPNAGAGSGDCSISPFPIALYTATMDGFATWANMPWFGATWMLPDPTGGAIGALPYPYSISPWVEAGYGDAYQGSIPTDLLSFDQPSATAPTIDVQDLASAVPFGIHIPSITLTFSSASTTSGLVLTDDPSVVGPVDPFGNVSCIVEIYTPGGHTPVVTDTINLAGLTSGSDLVYQYLSGSHGTYVVHAYYQFSYGGVFMFSGRGTYTTITLP